VSGGHCGKYRSGIFKEYVLIKGTVRARAPGGHQRGVVIDGGLRRVFLWYGLHGTHTQDGSEMRQWRALALELELWWERQE
jgi:hypothetical protein